MKRLYGRKTSKLFQEFHAWARPVIGKNVLFYEAPTRAPLGYAREMEDHVRVECRKSEPKATAEAVAAHEMMHIVLFREGFPKSDSRSSLGRQEAHAAGTIGTTLISCSAHPIIHRRLIEWGFNAVQQGLSETINNLVRRLGKDVAQPEAHTWQGKDMALAHAEVALSVGPDRFATVDELLSSRAPSVHVLFRGIVDIAGQFAHDQPEGNWQAMTRILDLIDEPNVRLRRLDGQVYPPSAQD